MSVWSCGVVIATFWPKEEMGRNQDGLGGYTCNVLTGSALRVDLG
jgi:hypothetical protein